MKSLVILTGLFLCLRLRNGDLLHVLIFKRTFAPLFGRTIT